MKITKSTVLSYMLSAMKNLGPEGVHGTAEIRTETIRVLTPEGGPPSQEVIDKVEEVFSPAGMSLRARGLTTSVTARSWALTDLGRAVEAGTSPMPPEGEKVPVYGKAKTVTTPTEPTPGTETQAEVPVVTVDTPAGTVAAEAETTTLPVDPPVSAVTETVVTETVVAETTTAEAVTIAPDLAKVEDLDALAAQITAAPNQGRRMKTASLAVLQPGAPDWMNDPYLRTLVYGNQECQGAWNGRDAACGSCVLSLVCRNHQAMGLGILATKLKEEEVAEETKRMQEAAIANLGPNRGNARAAADLRPGVPMTAQHDTLCARTGVPIVKGESVEYVVGVGVCKVAGANARK